MRQNLKQVYWQCGCPQTLKTTHEENPKTDEGTKPRIISLVGQGALCGTSTTLFIKTKEVTESRKWGSCSKLDFVQWVPAVKMNKVKS